MLDGDLLSWAAVAHSGLLGLVGTSAWEDTGTVPNSRDELTWKRARIEDTLRMKNTRREEMKQLWGKAGVGLAPRTQAKSQLSGTDASSLAPETNVATET